MRFWVIARGPSHMANAENLADNAEPNVVFRIELQADCKLPVHAPGAPVQPEPALPPWRQRFESALVQPRTDEERHAWYLWCQGHHHVFLYWQGTTLGFHPPPAPPGPHSP